MTGDFIKEYQIALGEFLLTFNMIESKVNEYVYLLLDRLHKRHLFSKGDSFQKKLMQLELLCCSIKPMHEPDFGKLKDIASQRNLFAHGSIHVDPNTGDFIILDATQQNKHKRIIPSFVRAQEKEANKALEDLEKMKPYVYFKPRA